MKISILHGDITTVTTDAIVNAANSSLLGGSGVDGAIHKNGGKAILEDCQKIRARQGNCKVGEAVITTGGLLPAKYVIHTVGPVWNNGGKEKEQLLINCYENAMRLASEHKLSSIAFPCISTGIYKFPQVLAAEIAVQAIKTFKNQKTIKEVLFVCFTNIDFEIYTNILESKN